MKLLNEHWNRFRSSQSLVDAYKTLYHSLGLQIKIVVNCSRSATGLCWCLASGGAWSSPEHLPADPFPKETGLHLALLSFLGVLLTCRAWAWVISFPQGPLWFLRDSALADSTWTVGMHHQHQNLIQETGLNWHPCLRKVFPALIPVLNHKIPVFKLPLCGRIAC